MKKMSKALFSVLIIGLLSTSCVPRKKLTYLQDKSELELDTAGFQVLRRSYYQVQINDLLSIQIKTFNEDLDKYFNVMEQQNNMMGGGQMGASARLYFNGYSVDPLGNIELPVLGRIYVAGLTVDEITETVTQKLGDFFNQDVIYVKVQLAGIRFTVIGEAGNGQFYIYQNQANIFEALAMAGGADFLGDRRRVQIVRQYPEGVKYFELDLTDKAVVSDPRYFVQPNDIINVKPLRQRSWGIGETGFQTITSLMGAIGSSLALYLFIENTVTRNRQ